MKIAVICWIHTTVLVCMCEDTWNWELGAHMQFPRTLALVAVTFTVSELDIEMLSQAIISFHLPDPVSPGSLTSIPLNSDTCFDHPSSSPH